MALASVTTTMPRTADCDVVSDASSNNRPLRIFISHKMPTDTQLASEVGNLLALYGANRVRVVHAGEFRYGDEWRERIEKELTDADWLIYLCTDQDEDWGFCLFECGFFRNTMRADSKKKLVTLARETSQISDALKEFNAAVITEDTAFELLAEIYRKDPWKINPELRDSDLRTTARRIAELYGGIRTITEQRDVTPSITIEFDESKARDLDSDRIPANATINGSKQWQQLFGKDTDTGAWQWEELTKEWPYRYVYEFLLARMMRDALAKKLPQGCMLRAEKTDELYRVSLRRYQKQANNKYVFFFNASPFDLPFAIPRDDAKKKEAVLFHLINLSWYFRRRVVEGLYIKLLQIQTTKAAPARMISARNLFDELSHELMDIEAQSIIRGIDNRLDVQDALGTEPNVHELLDRVEEWYELRKQMFEDMAAGVEKLAMVIEKLSFMAELNFEFYKVTAHAYAEASLKLEKPRPVPGTVLASIAAASGAAKLVRQ